MNVDHSAVPVLSDAHPELFPAIRQHAPTPDSAALRTQIELLLQPCAIDAEKEETVKCK